MFSNLFSGVTLYITLALLASTAGFGYLSYSLYADKAVAVAQLKDTNKAILGYQKDAELKDSSCKLDDTSVVESIAEKQEVRDKIDNLVVKINKLKTGVAIAPIKTQTGNLFSQSEVYVDNNGLLSPELKSLLYEAYCQAEICPVQISP